MNANRRLIFKALAGALLLAAPAFSRDPEPADSRRRDPRPLYERVESDIDRGTGRIEDEQTHEVRRLQEPPLRDQGEYDRFQDDYDRRQRLDARGQRANAAARESASPSKTPPARSRETLEHAPGPFGSTLTRFVAEQEQLLTAAQQSINRICIAPKSSVTKHSAPPSRIPSARSRPADSKKNARS